MEIAIPKKCNLCNLQTYGTFCFPHLLDTGVQQILSDFELKMLEISHRNLNKEDSWKTV